MSFDTAYQNTGLSEGQGLRPYNPKSVTKHKAPIGGCRSTPLWKRKKRELFSSLFSLSLRQSLGHTSVFSERDGDCLCSGRRKECCYLLPRTGLKGALPPADLLRYSEAGGNPQSSSPFEKGGRTPSLNFTLGALPQTPHSPCGRRERRVAFPSARAVCRSVPSRDG